LSTGDRLARQEPVTRRIPEWNERKKHNSNTA